MLLVKQGEQGVGLTSLAVVKGEVAHRVLLVPYARPRGTAVEGQVCEKATTALFNEQANMHDIGSGGHVEDNVLEACGLRGGPMHACGCLP